MGKSLLNTYQTKHPNGNQRYRGKFRIKEHFKTSFLRFLLHPNEFTLLKTLNEKFENNKKTNLTTKIFIDENEK